ncbi:MAG TPA: hypothetical protein VF862_03825 [Gemmatimonadales bacterium]
MRYIVPSLLMVLSFDWSIPLRPQLPEWVQQILTAAQLPMVATEARREGVASDQVRAALEAMRTAGVPPSEATLLMDSARAARREHGPVDNFGAFVQSQLAAGKRGQELAAAIRAEHARQGKGNAAREGKTQPPGARGAPDRKPDNRGQRRPPNG